MLTCGHFNRAGSVSILDCFFQARAASPRPIAGNGKQNSSKSPVSQKGRTSGRRLLGIRPCPQFARAKPAGPISKCPRRHRWPSRCCRIIRSPSAQIKHGVDVTMFRQPPRLGDARSKKFKVCPPSEPPSSPVTKMASPAFGATAQGLFSGVPPRQAAQWRYNRRSGIRRWSRRQQSPHPNFSASAFRAVVYFYDEPNIEILGQGNRSPMPQSAFRPWRQCPLKQRARALRRFFPAAFARVK